MKKQQMKYLQMMYQRMTKQDIYNYQYFEIPPVIQNNEIISSTTIRKKLAEGKIKEVNEMLGYTYGIEETVVYGQQLGRKLGFKTANLIYPKNLIAPKNGVYSALVKYQGKTYKAIANNLTQKQNHKQGTLFLLLLMCMRTEVLHLS